MMPKNALITLLCIFVVFLPVFRSAEEKEWVRDRSIPGDQDMLPFNLTIPSNVTHRTDDLLPKDYDKTKPPRTGHEPVYVKVSLKVLNIRSVDEDKSEITMDLFLYQKWFDSRVIFPYKDRLRIVLDSAWNNRLWTPDIYFKNSFRGSIHEVVSPEAYLLFFSNKLLFYAARISLTLNCPMLLETYPHDIQECPIIMAMLQHTIDAVDLRWDHFKVNKRVSLAQFDVSVMARENCSREYKDLGTFACICGGLRLTRRLGYYFINMYLPSFLIVIMSFVTFWLPAEAYPARVALPVTSLLSLVTQLRQSAMPNVSYVMAISIWMSTCIAFVFLSLLEYALVISVMDNRKARKQELEALQREALEFLGESKMKHFDLRAIGEEGTHMSHVDIDKFARILYPIVFLVFGLFYWLVYGA